MQTTNVTKKLTTFNTLNELARCVETHDKDYLLSVVKNYDLSCFIGQEVDEQNFVPSTFNSLKVADEIFGLALSFKDGKETKSKGAVKAPNYLRLKSTFIERIQAEIGGHPLVEEFKNVLLAAGVKPEAVALIKGGFYFVGTETKTVLGEVQLVDEELA